MKKLIFFVFSLFLLSACKNSTLKKNSPHQASGSYVNEETGKEELSYNIEPPKGWIKFDTIIMGNHLTVLKSPIEENDNFRENVNVVTEPSGNLDLDEYVDKNIVQMQSGLKDFREHSRMDKIINGIKFKNIKYSHNYSGMPIDVDVYFTVHKGKGYVVTCTTTEGNLYKWLPAFNEAMNSFSFN